MSIDTAVEVVRKLRPRWVIPSHWSPANGGGYLDVKAFQAALAGLAEVVIPGEAATAAAV
jgi:L-ascorbate metabolism protein UlaG (beta-lactamase superfamily)